MVTKGQRKTLPSNRKKKTTTTKKTTANDENISPPKRKRASALKTVLQEDIVDESPLPPRAQKRKISLDSHHDLPSPKFRKVAQGEDKVQELEHQLKDLQRKYQRLRELRETEPEKLLRESLEKFKSHRDASDKLINHFKKGKGNVEIQSSVEKDDELKEKNKHDHHILRFFEDLTGIKVEYCQDFEVQTKKMNRRFSTATLERQTKPFKCTVTNESETSKVSFLLWTENDEIEYRPLSVQLEGDRESPEFMSEEIVFEKEQGPVFLSRFFAEIHCPDVEQEEEEPEIEL